MNTLEKLIADFVKRNSPNTTRQDQQLLEAALTEKILEETKQLLTVSEKKKLKSILESTEKEERARLKLQRVAGIVIEAVFLAFFVGLIVNQVTSLLDLMFVSGPGSRIATAALTIIISAIIISWILFTRISLRAMDGGEKDG